MPHFNSILEKNLKKRKLMKKKECEKCKNNFRMLFRVQYTPEKKWVFICNDCVIEVRRDNEDYRYGGTWKG